MQQSFELIDVAQQKLYTQRYDKKTVIQDVQLIPLKHFVSDEGDFGELVRLNSGGAVEAMPSFVVRQISRSRIVPGAIKGWHMHFEQDELWYVAPNEQLFIGLWDCRKNSTTSNETMRINAGGGESSLIYIPRGVAHGCANFSSKDVSLLYYMNNTFNSTNPDEQRIPYDTLTNFWLPERD